MEPESHADEVGLNRTLELRMKELEALMKEVRHHQAIGTHVLGLEHRVEDLKEQIRKIRDEDEIDPQSEWSIKAHQLV